MGGHDNIKDLLIGIQIVKVKIGKLALSSDHSLFYENYKLCTFKIYKVSL